jgi:uncharacterized protein (DUF1778 family)
MASGKDTTDGPRMGLRLTDDEYDLIQRAAALASQNGKATTWVKWLALREARKVLEEAGEAPPQKKPSRTKK